jgi:anti-sigma B factor antagonist
VPTPELSVDVQRDADRLTVALVGELDISTKDTLIRAVTEAISDPVRVVEIQAQGLSFCDSSGLAAIIGLRRSMKADGRHVYLAHPRPQLQTVLEITGLQTLAEPDRERFPRG